MKQKYYQRILDLRIFLLNNSDMHKPKNTTFSEPAFTLDKDDRFHQIIVSNPVLFELSPDTETVLTFIVIQRASGKFSVVNVIKTFQTGKCVSRSVQDKSNIPAINIDAEMTKIQADFTRGVQAQTNYKIQWATLNLSKITDKKIQLERIRKWGRLNVC